MTKLRLSAYHAGPRGTSSMMMSSIITTSQVSFSGPFLLKKVRRYFPIYTRGFVGIMLHQGAWSKRLSENVGTGYFGSFQESSSSPDHPCYGQDAKIGSKQAVSFIQDIIFCFGVPNSIITDSGTEFTGEKFLDFCDDNNIWVDWAMVAHPRTNGLVERMNGLILQGLKPRILTQEGEDVHA
jgi:hypothetical protein